MGRTTIEWAQFTTNPIRARDRETGKVGHWCEKVSAGCANCYSSTLQTFRFHGHPFDVRFRDKVEVYFEPRALDEVLRRRIPTRWFWCDMTDLFGDWVPYEWLDRIFATMALTPHHRHLVLTKRPARMRAYLTGHAEGGRHIWRAAQAIEMPGGRDKPDTGWPLPGVWLGVSVEDQRHADQRIPLLLETPAAIRFVSAEPLLGPITLRAPEVGDWPEAMPTHSIGNPAEWDDWKYWAARDRGIRWVIVGGESGPGARPMREAWALALRDQCQAAGVPFFFKQWGKWLPAVGRTGDGEIYAPAAEDDRSLDPFGDGTYMLRAPGPKWPGELGHTLQGHVYQAFPA